MIEVIENTMRCGSGNFGISNRKIQKRMFAYF
jgi:hypothetical protein